SRGCEPRGTRSRISCRSNSAMLAKIPNTKSGFHDRLAPGVAAMPKVIATLLRAETWHALAEQGPESLDRAAARRAHDRLQFREAELDRIEVGAVRREIPHHRTRGGEDLFDATDLVRGQVIGDHDVARAERGH